MRKIIHEAMIDSAKPANASEPVFVLITGCAFPEIQGFVSEQLKALAPWNGLYQLAVEFTEPETDPRFVQGYVGARISVRTETEELANEMRQVLC